MLIIARTTGVQIVKGKVKGITLT